MEITVTGLEELAAELRRVSDVVEQYAMVAGVKAGCKVIAHEMREAAPVLDERTAKSTSLEPGALKEGIKVFAPHAKDGYVEEIVGPSSKTQYVADWVEYGHRLVKGGQSLAVGNGKWRGSGHEIGEVKPHPFLRPAFEAASGEALEACTAAASAELKKGL